MSGAFLCTPAFATGTLKGCTILLVAHAMRHVQLGQAKEQAVSPQPIVLTPELLSELRVLLTQTTVSEEHTETAQITETSSVATLPDMTPDTQEKDAESVLLAVSEVERNKVIAAYQHGIPRREICSYLKWGSAKYSTIVKPVLDTYEEQQQRTVTE